MQDLAGGIARHLVGFEEHDLARAFEPGQTIARPCDQARRIRFRPRAWYDHGHDPLAPFRIFYADHRNLTHIRVNAHDLLDFGGVDVLAARDDQILLAVD